jgi:hypothetical protein
MIRQAFSVGCALLLLLFIAGFTYAVRVRENTPLDSDTPPEGAQYCVDITKNQSICTSDPRGVWRQVFSQRTTNEMHPGIPQRIDGTEAEQNSIKTVIKLMNLYWYEEVLSNFEYETVRTSW